MAMITLPVFQSFLYCSQRLQDPTFKEQLEYDRKIHFQRENKGES